MGGADFKTEELIEKVVRELGSNARSDTVFGELVQRDGVAVIPVAAARVGVGGGTGVGKDAGRRGGVGAGMSVSPVGYIEVSDGDVRFRRILPTWAFVSLTLGIGALVGLLYFLLRTAGSVTSAR